MRQLKFRAWDLKKKEMFIPDEFVLNYNDNTLHQVDRIGTDSILMQYTGLKDLTGKEIYEGDTIEINWSWIKNSIFIVMFGEYNNDQDFEDNISGVGFYLVGPSKYDLGHIKWIKKSRINGNIYENPELLKTESES